MFNVPLLPLDEYAKGVLAKFVIVGNQGRITARVDAKTKLGLQMIATMHIIC